MRKRRTVRQRAIAAIAVALVFSTPSWATSPTAAGFLSVVPGLGEVAEGNPAMGIGYLLGLIALSSAASSLGNTNAGSIVGEAGTSFYFYQMYAAYRDGHPANHMYGDSNLLTDYAAALNPMNALDLKVAGFDGVAGYQGASNGGGASYNPLWLLYWGVGVQQEEALYRGFLYPAFTDWFGGSKVLAGITTSMLDAAQHALYMPDALNPVVFGMRTLIFSYLTWVYTVNKYNLPRNVFAHAWFDYLQRTPGATYGSASRLQGAMPPHGFQGAVFGVRLFF